MLNPGKLSSLVLVFSCLFIAPSASMANVPKAWAPLSITLLGRYEQQEPKMKLNEQQVENFISYLNKLKTPTPELIKLQTKLPKTTLELLRATQSRGVDLAEAEKMASYLYTLVDKCKFKHVNKFDENTSHIIGRDWPEIDYTGEGMTWEAQRLKYLPYGIEDFRSAAQLAKFFPVEAKLPYFNKVYEPENPHALGQ